MMNCELHVNAQTKIIIPTAYRDDYLLALRKFSRQNEPDAYIRMLDKIQAFIATFDFKDYQQTLLKLKVANAFCLPSEGKLDLKRQNDM